jgi:hypothetical protein
MRCLPPGEHRHQRRKLALACSGHLQLHQAEPQGAGVPAIRSESTTEVEPAESPPAISRHTAEANSTSARAWPSIQDRKAEPPQGRGVHHGPREGHALLSGNGISQRCTPEDVERVGHCPNREVLSGAFWGLSVPSKSLK